MTTGANQIGHPQLGQRGGGRILSRLARVSSTGRPIGPGQLIQVGLIGAELFGFGQLIQVGGGHQQVGGTPAAPSRCTSPEAASRNSGRRTVIATTRGSGAA